MPILSWGLLAPMLIKVWTLPLFFLNIGTSSPIVRKPLTLDDGILRNCAWDTEFDLNFKTQIRIKSWFIMNNFRGIVNYCDKIWSSKSVIYSKLGNPAYKQQFSSCNRLKIARYSFVNIHLKLTIRKRSEFKISHRTQVNNIAFHHTYAYHNVAVSVSQCDNEYQPIDIHNPCDKYTTGHRSDNRPFRQHTPWCNND